MSNRPGGESLFRLLRDATLIVLLASLAGAAVNGRLLRQVWSGQAPASSGVPAADSMAELLPMPVSLEELRSMSAEDALLLDARSRDLYLQGHLPGARSLPWGEIDTLLEEFRGQVPLDRPLIAYCSGYGCEDSFHLGQRLMAAGYADVRVYEGGLPEWRDAGLPVEEGQP